MFQPHKQHNKEDFDKMREAGVLVADTLEYLAPFVKPGITTLELDTLAADFIKKNNAVAACLHYNSNNSYDPVRGFPKSICTSANDVACHGIPNSYEVLKEGDIINIDVTVITPSGFHGDHSINFILPGCQKSDINIVQAAFSAMMRGISVCKMGVFTGAVGYEAEGAAIKHGVNPLKGYCGHSIGRYFHGNLMLPAHGKKFQGEPLLPGYFFTIEPILTQGKDKTVILADRWTVKTVDAKKTAQFEHTLGITLDGKDVEIFTVSTNLRRMMGLGVNDPVLYSHAKDFLTFEKIAAHYGFSC